MTNRISDDVIREVLARNSIVEVVGQHVHLTKRGKNYTGLCPFHSEKTPSFTVSPDKQIFHCFGCGVGGNAIKFIMELEGQSFIEAVHQLAERVGITIQRQKLTKEQSERQRIREQMIEAHEMAAKFFHYILKNTEQGKEAMRYLQSRRFSNKSIDTFQIGYAPAMKDSLLQFLTQRKFPLPQLAEYGLITRNEETGEYSDRFRDRIMFPICDSKGRVIAFAGRVLDDRMPKYLNTPETALFNKSGQLFNFHMARPAIRKIKRAILFEGYVDVIKAWEAGIQHGIATMGTALTEQHVRLLRHHTDELIICYDGDAAGQAAAEKNIDMLESGGVRVYVADMPAGMDPDEYMERFGAERFVNEIIGQPLTSVSFKLRYAATQFDLSQDAGKLDYVRHALKNIIAKRSSPTEREHYVQELSEQYGYSFATLMQELNEFRRTHSKNWPQRDNNANQWNNVRNKSKAERANTTLLPAYHNAEKYLLSLMMHDRQTTQFVEQQLGDRFNVEVYAALAAYLYAYYADYEQMDISLFLSMLQDEKLENAASAIYLLDPGHAKDARVIHDYIHTIRNFSEQHAILKQKKKEMKQAEQAGDVILAAKIAQEIISLERNLK